MSSPTKTLSESKLRDCLDSRGFVALIVVKNARLEAPGTRGEAVTITATVEEAIHGEASGTITLHRYTSGGNRVVAAGKKYVVAVSGPGEGNMLPFVLLDQVEVAAGAEAQAVHAHKELLQRITPGR